MNTDELMELRLILAAIDRHNYFVIIEDYSIVKRQLTFGVYSRAGTRYYISRTNFCYDATDQDMCDHICNVLTEELKISLSDLTVFIPTHAASLYETFVRNDFDCTPYHCGEMTDFCPNCGADMRGDNNDER